MTTAYYLSERLKEFRRRKRRCVACGRFIDYKDAEFHHLYSTGLSGMGRGLSNRVRDLKRNPTAYALMHHDCHIHIHRMGGDYDN